MTELTDERTRAGVARLRDDSAPLGERVQALVDDDRLDDRDVRDAIVAYGRQLRTQEQTPQTDRRLDALVRLARGHELDVSRADFRTDGQASATETAHRDVLVDSIATTGGCISADDDLEVTATVLNVTDREQAHTVEVAVDDELVHETGLVLGAGEVRTVSYTLSFDATGEYEIGIGPVETVDIEVLEPSAGIIDATGGRDRTDREGPPVEVRDTSDDGTDRSDRAPAPITASGTGDGDRAPLDLPPDYRPLPYDGCEFVPPPDDGPETAVDAGVLVVGDDAWFGVSRIEIPTAQAGGEGAVRSLRSYVGPFLDGLEFPTEIVALPPSAVLQPYRPETDGGDGTESGTDPIETALAEYTERLDAEQSDPVTDWDQFVVTQLRPEDLGDADGESVLGNIKRRALPDWGGDETDARATRRQAVDERFRTIRRALRPLELDWAPVDSKRVALRAVSAAVGVDAPERARSAADR